MSLKHLASRIPVTAAWVVTHPVQTTGRAVGFARGVVVGGIGLVETLRQPVPEEQDTAPAADPEPPAPAEEVPPADEVPGTVNTSTGEYVVPPPSSAPPAEPPIDVVGQALAAEAAEAAEPEPVLLGGTQGEPHPVTREEEHEGAPLTRAELDEIEDETDEALEGDDGEVLPDQGLLLDPGVAKAVRSEAEVLQDAADPDKG